MNHIVLTTIAAVGLSAIGAASVIYIATRPTTFNEHALGIIHGLQIIKQDVQSNQAADNSGKIKTN